MKPFSVLGSLFSAFLCVSAIDLGPAKFTTNGVDFFYAVEGVGTPIVLIHGWTCDQTDWAFQIPFLNSIGFQTIAIDLRGHGRSQVVTGSEDLYATSLFTDDVAAFMDHLNLTDTLVMGHSLGTVITLDLAIRYPALVKGIVLVDPIYYLPGVALDVFLLGMQGNTSPVASAAFFDSAFYTLETPAWLKAWHRRRTWGTPAEVVTSTINQLFAGPDGLGRRENAVVYNKQLTVPRLVTCADTVKIEVEAEIGIGEEDKVELIPAGHWHHQQRADDFNTAVQTWFSERGYLPTIL